MIYDQLGQTKLQVSKICLGTMTFGEQNTEAEGHEQLDYALDQGVNFIDTAEMYAVPGRKETQGSTEQIIGNWIAKRKNRDKFILATKVTGPSKMTWIRNPLRFTRKQITTAIEGSLQRLQTDYVDLYQLHWPERKTNFFGKRSFVYDSSDPWADNFLDILETLRDLQQAGKIRHFGISNETPWGTMRYLQEADKHDLPRCMSVQNPYSILNRSYEVGMAEISIREKCGLLAYSPLAFGLLSNKYHEGMDTARDRLNKFKQMSRYNHQTAREAASAYYELARENGMSLAQMALAFVNSRPFVTSNIIGATTMQQLRENIASIDITLSNSIIQGIETIQDRIPNPAP
ncbi:MAG: NADP(H)-dependent aldo-keto reductase [Saprospiraceae bacterium]|nr:NADP(H)-dependent aldo-keto reductase [Saprospiraceae bacterium]